MGSPIFFGTKSDKLSFDKAHNIKEIPDEVVPKEKPEPERQRIRIDLDTLEPISESMLDDIKKTWLRHDPYTVWMQSDLGFYDDYYMEDRDANDPLTLAARAIRRTYRNYPDYHYACQVRDVYIERLFNERYNGNEVLFQSAIRNGTVEWIPPRPIYSTSSSDYERYKNGMADVIEVEPMDDDEYLEELRSELESYDNESEGVCVDVFTNLKGLREIEAEMDADAQTSRQRNGLNAMRNMDLRNFKEIVQSWYKPSESQSSKPEVEPFSKTPEGIRKAYYRSFMVDLTDISKRIDDGTIFDEDPVDMHELVFDERTGKPMTRIDKARRDALRCLEKYGWSTIQTMKALNIGSKAEQRDVALKEKSARKNRLKASDIMDKEMQNIYGTSPSSLESSGYEEYMNKYFFGGSE